MRVLCIALTAALLVCESSGQSHPLTPFDRERRAWRFSLMMPERPTFLESSAGLHEIGRGEFDSYQSDARLDVPERFHLTKVGLRAHLPSRKLAPGLLEFFPLAHPSLHAYDDTSPRTLYQSAR